MIHGTYETEYLVKGTSGTSLDTKLLHTMGPGTSVSLNATAAHTVNLFNSPMRGDGEIKATFMGGRDRNIRYQIATVEDFPMGVGYGPENTQASIGILNPFFQIVRDDGSDKNTHSVSGRTTYNKQDGRLLSQVRAELNVRAYDYFKGLPMACMPGIIQKTAAVVGQSLFDDLVVALRDPSYAGYYYLPGAAYVYGKVLNDKIGALLKRIEGKAGLGKGLEVQGELKYGPSWNKTIVPVSRSELVAHKNGRVANEYLIGDENNSAAFVLRRECTTFPFGPMHDESIYIEVFTESGGENSTLWISGFAGLNIQHFIPAAEIGTSPTQIVTHGGTFNTNALAFAEHYNDSTAILEFEAVLSALMKLVKL